MTMLHGGVCHRISTPHKSVTKMKRKKKLCVKQISRMDFGHIVGFQ